MEELDWNEVIYLVWKRKIILLVLIILGTLGGYLYSNNLITPMYKASTTVILSVKGDNENISLDENETVTNDEIKLSENLMDTYQKIIKSKAVASEIKKNINSNLSEEDIQNSIVFKNNSNTMVIEIIVQNKDPEIAFLIANEVPNVFFEKISGVYNIKNAEVLDKAEKPSEPFNIKPIQFACIGFLLALTIFTIIIFIEINFNKKIKTEYGIEEKLGIPVLTTIGLIPEREVNLVTARNSSCSEIFRILLSSIKHLNSKIILVTSCNPGEGKSFIASNVAITYAKSGKKTLLIDSDIRRGRQEEIFSIDSCKEGISNLIKNDDIKNFEKYITHSEYVENLDIITKGTASINYSKLLYTDIIVELIKHFEKQYDFIIIDGTPKALVADDIAFSSIVDYTILVVRYNKVLLNDVKKLKKMIANKDALGLVLNGFPGSLTGRYKYNYYRYSTDRSLKRVKQ